MKHLALIAFLLVMLPIFEQNSDEEKIYTLRKNQWIWYSDIGYRTSPFTLRYDFTPEIDKLKFRHNIKPILGIGVHYKWFALRIGLGLPFTFFSVNQFGKHLPFNLGTQFSVKKLFFDIDLRLNGGYVIKDAYRWNSDLTELEPHQLMPRVGTGSLSFNVWHFRNTDINMRPILGRVGNYNRNASSIYLKYSLNVFEARHGDSHTTSELIPLDLINSAVSSTNASRITVMDVGLIPGYAMVKKLNNWQFSFIGGIGGVIQSKFYTNKTGLTRGFLGIAPRIDLRIIGGFNNEHYFCHLDTDFDIKTARIQNMAYRQYFYSIKLVGGIRLKEKNNTSKRKRSR